ncbi:hypothetical protein [Rikenella microfusus]|uniref:Peptidase S24/S26A/S26B/S26C domain-containing protein n=1 Tax=Rikenella microfusus TaxID=28139 RepID=A0A379MQQ5_9BACT|nr:hypothetical protein [Rikenella microfusus]SUE32952.1 Uncharacterised protein [Rikenella microfusus]HJE88466.1 hypothetical protein [Rikenella microfusus]
MTDWQRLEQVIKWTGLSTNAFAAGIGLKRSENLYQIKRGNNSISKNLAELITRKYPSVNRAWLLTGEGDMFAENEKREGIPYYKKDVLRLVCETAGCDADDYIRMPGFGECDFAAPVTGDAMAPEVPAGATVVLEQVDPLAPVLSGEIYVAVTSAFALLRYVKPDPEIRDALWLTAPAGAGSEPVRVLREHLIRLYLVKGIVIHKVL